ncbi:MAG: hypothetical protein EFT35_03085 [Methanophagales archaeon ANME-1-THS]|nr:MAG: hypothetical protein EFT35_03085 [Methanophagales archaeon ANME-1-THS]
MEPDIAGILSQFKSIKKHANELLEPVDKPGFFEEERDPIPEIDGLAEEYDDARTNFDSLERKHNIGLHLRDITSIQLLFTNHRAVLRQICIECEKAIGVLESIATPLPKEELAQLKMLREELKKLSGALDINYEKKLKRSYK